MAWTKTPGELAKIRERVAQIVRTFDEPPGLYDLSGPCADFATEFYVRAALLELVEQGRLRRKVVRSARTGQVKAVYEHVPTPHPEPANRTRRPNP